MTEAQSQLGPRLVPTEAERTRSIGIREASAQVGLSVDTLRWYEKEGLIPPISRGHDGRRLFAPRDLAFIRLLVTLRNTGMPIAEVKNFVQLAGLGASSHAKRQQLLEDQLARIAQQEIELREHRDRVEQKIEHYAGLIAAGLDCDGLPLRQRAGSSPDYPTAM